MEWLDGNWKQLAEAFVYLVLACGVIANFTKTDIDNRIVRILMRLIEVLGLRVRK
jgi:hypothetical protein